MYIILHVIIYVIQYIACVRVAYGYACWITLELCTAPILCPYRVMYTWLRWPQAG